MSSLLLVDDDKVFCEVLSRALEKRGFATQVAHSISQATQLAETTRPDFAVIDLRLAEESGLSLIPTLLEQNCDIRMIMLTAYASIATAVEAIKLGATQYLTKPADADEILAALRQGQGNAEVPVPEKPTPLQRLEWEHIQKVLTECEGNISAAARKLGLHRRTLQRKLQKRPTNLE